MLKSEKKVLSLIANIETKFNELSNLRKEHMSVLFQDKKSFDLLVLRLGIEQIDDVTIGMLKKFESAVCKHVEDFKRYMQEEHDEISDTTKS